MDFEFDPAKSAANLKKHGIDFVGAQVLWSDPDRLEIPARSLDEPRAQVIGRIGEWCGRRSSRCGTTVFGLSPSGEHAMKNKQRTSKTRHSRPPNSTPCTTPAQPVVAHGSPKAVRPGRAVQRVNVDFPVDLLREIDQEARRLGVTRQAFIKVRLADSLVKVGQ